MSAFHQPPKAAARLALRLAWRNLGRNRRRSAISVAAVAFALFFAVVMRSLQLGVYGHMIETLVGNVLGYTEVAAEGYWPLQSLDAALPENPEWLAAVEADDQVGKAAPRVSGFAWLSGAKGGSAAQLVGIDAAREKRSVGDGPPGSIWLGPGLARQLGVTVGDSVVGLGQGYQGSFANGGFVVAGEVTVGNPDLEKRLAVISLLDAQQFYGAYGLWTSVVLSPDEPTNHRAVAARLPQDHPLEGAVWRTWEERMPELDQAIRADSTGGLVVLSVLYVVIGFGLLGTMLMLAEERKREFSMQIALGVSRRLLAATVFLEATFLAALGALIGGGVGRLVVEIMHVYPLRLRGELAEAIVRQGWAPILPPSMDPSIVVTHALLIWLLAVLVALWPVRAVFNAPTVFRG